MRAPSKSHQGPPSGTKHSPATRKGSRRQVARRHLVKEGARESLNLFFPWPMAQKEGIPCISLHFFQKLRTGEGDETSVSSGSVRTPTPSGGLVPASTPLLRSDRPLVMLIQLLCSQQSVAQCCTSHQDPPPSSPKGENEKTNPRVSTNFEKWQSLGPRRWGLLGCRSAQYVANPRLFVQLIWIGRSQQYYVCITRTMLGITPDPECTRK